MTHDLDPTQVDPKSALYARFIAFFSDIPGTTDRFGDHEKFFTPTPEQQDMLRSSETINNLGFYSFTAVYISPVAHVVNTSDDIETGKDRIFFTAKGDVDIDYILEYDATKGEVSFEKEVSSVQDGVVRLSPVYAKIALGTLLPEELTNFFQSLALEKDLGLQDPTAEEIEGIMEVLDRLLESPRT